MHKFYAGYGLLVMLLFAGATHHGYAFSSIFTSARHATAAQNHYYHK